MDFIFNAEPLLKTFWFIALPASLIFIIQTIMTFMGADAMDGADADFDSNLDGTDTPFQLFSLRNLINFLLGFGWSGLSFYETIENHTLLIFLATGVGALFVLLFFLIIKQLMKLAEDNSFKLSDTLNLTGEVYLTIPGKKEGKGKIMISVKGAMHELDAITLNETIERGKIVRVVNIESGNLLIVETL